MPPLHWHNGAYPTTPQNFSQKASFRKSTADLRCSYGPSRAIPWTENDRLGTFPVSRFCIQDPPSVHRWLSFSMSSRDHHEHKPSCHRANTTSAAFLVQRSLLPKP